MATTLRNISISSSKATTIFFEPVWKDMITQGNFRVMANVTSKKKIGYVQQLENIIQKATGCGFTPKGQVGVYTREIEVDQFKVNISQCFDVFKDTIFEEQLKKGNMQYDTDGTIMGNILITKVRDAMDLDYTRLFWWGDKASSDANNNLTDGIWSVHIPALVAANQTPYVNANSGSPLAPGDAIDLLKEVYENQALVLKGLPKSMKRFYVSDSVYEAYESDLEALGGGDAGRTQLINGVEMLSYRGIALVNNAKWDEYTTNVLGTPNTHQVLLSAPDNLIFATDLLSSLNSIEIFFDKLEEQVYMKVNGKFGTNYVHPKLMVAAY